MTQLVSMETDILDTVTENATNNWNQLLSLQTEMFLPHEICYFLKSKIWQEAVSVLDVGCGNGAYISNISNFFPEKTYTAIDQSPELISIAKSTYARSNVQFQQQSLETFQVDKPFDIVLMRLIVQHLSDFPTVLSTVSKLLKPGGTLLIIEPDFDNFYNWPETPKMDHMMQSMDHHSAQQNTNRRYLPKLGGMATETGKWNIADDTVTTASFVGPFNNSKLLRLYHLWIDILDHSQILSMPLREVRNELKNWAETPTSYAQIGMRFLNLQKI